MITKPQLHAFYRLPLTDEEAPRLVCCVGIRNKGKFPIKVAVLPREKSIGSWTVECRADQLLPREDQP